MEVSAGHSQEDPSARESTSSWRRLSHLGSLQLLMQHSRHPLQPRGGLWGTPSESGTPRRSPVQRQTTQYNKRLFTFCPCFIDPGLTVLIHGWGPGVQLLPGERAPCFVILRNCLRSLLAMTRKEVSVEGTGNHSCLFILLLVTLN